MVSIFAKKLDELMGKDRNKTYTITSNEVNLMDPNICKFFVCSVCPYGLFPNTKFDFGECSKSHDL
jgi:hypothetical protein